jgi:hypothetical protein
MTLCQLLILYDVEFDVNNEFGRIGQKVVEGYPGICLDRQRKISVMIDVSLVEF